MGSKPRKSWQEKLAFDKGLPKVVTLTGRLAEKWGKGTMAIPTPKEVDGIIRKVPKGKLITINEIRDIVAKRYKATVGCPITCGIFAWIAAHAAEEARSEGKKNITCWWRTLKAKGELNEKYPGGVAVQKKLLEKEGHKVNQKGKKMLIVGLEKSLVKL